jgi:hypothetical protein
MTLDGYQLLFGPDEGALQETQGDPVARPVPVPRPPSRLEQFSPRPPADAAPLDGLDLLFGDKPQPAAPPQARPPEEPSFWSQPIRSTVRAIRGRQDPAYKDVPEYIASGDAGAGMNLLAGKLLGADDAAYGDIIARDIGDRLIRREKDAHGYEVMVYRGADGSEKKAYVNKPGLGGEDVNRLLLGAAPYVAGGGAVNALARSLGLGGLTRALAQGTAAGATSLATNVGEIAFGSEQGIDPVRAGFAAAGGAGGEAIASGINAASRALLARSLVNRDGTLTAKGIEAARAAGVDPGDLQGDLARTFARTYAMSPDAAEAGARFSTDALGIPTTVGQRTKDAAHLLDEKAMRYGVYGEKAKQVMQDFDRRQQGAIAGQVYGRTDFTPDGAPVVSGIGLRLQPDHFKPRPVEIGQRVKKGLAEAKAAEKAVEKAAWAEVPDLIARPGAFDDLPAALSGQLGKLRVDETVTPTAWKMAQALDDFVSGRGLTEGAPAVLRQAPIRTVDEMRRQLGTISRSAKEPADRAAASAIYDGFNDWIETAAQKSLLSGAPEAAAALRTARAVSKEIKDLFEARDVRGQTTAGARLLRNVMERADSPESIVAELLGAAGPRTAPKAGVVEALQTAKKLLVERPAARGQTPNTEAWNDLRLAYWLRLAEGTTGELKSPYMIRKSIDEAFQNQSTVLRTLYTPEERRAMRALSRALEKVAYKDPNPSGTGTAGAYYVRQFVTKLMDAIGFSSKPVQMALEYTGLGNAYGAAKARAAIAQQLKAPPRNMLLSPAGGYGLASQVERDTQ